MLGQNGFKIHTDNGKKIGLLLDGNLQFGSEIVAESLLNPFVGEVRVNYCDHHRQEQRHTDHWLCMRKFEDSEEDDVEQNKNNSVIKVDGVGDTTQILGGLCEQHFCDYTGRTAKNDYTC